MRRRPVSLGRATPVWAFVLIVIGTTLAAEPLEPRLDGDRIRVSAPSLRFLVEAPLERLHNGTSVTFTLTLGLRNEPDVPAAELDTQRCTVSYDLWEEKFAVTHLAPTPSSISHLSAEAAEAWCVNKLSLPIARLANDQPFWLRLQFVEESMADESEDSGPFGLALGNLIDIFSRRGREQLLQGREESGPVRLRDLQ